MTEAIHSDLTWRVWASKITGHWWFRMVFAPWLVSRAVLSLIGALSLYMIPPGTFSFSWNINGSGQTDYLQKGDWPQPKRWFVNSWSRWDSWWYYTIARYGYGTRGSQAEETNSNFFPLYPMLMSTVKLTGNPPPLRYFQMGILISNAALLGLLTLLVKLARLDFDEATARGAVLALLVFPSTLFFSAVYVESLFLLIVLGAFLAARQQRWWLAGLLAGLATATRAPGVVLGPALVIEYLAQRGWRWREIRPNILWLALAPVGIAAFLGYQKYFLPHGLDMTTSFQQGHKRFLTWPWVAFEPFFKGTYSSLRWENSLLDLAFTLFFFVLSLFAFRLRASYGFFCAATVLFVTCTASLSGIGRYGLALFPIFLLFGMAMKKPWFERAWLCACSALAAYFMALFASWHFYM